MCGHLDARWDRVRTAGGGVGLPWDRGPDCGEMTRAEKRPCEGSRVEHVLRAASVLSAAAVPEAAKDGVCSDEFAAPLGKDSACADSAVASEFPTTGDTCGVLEANGGVTGHCGQRSFSRGSRSFFGR